MISTSRGLPLLQLTQGVQRSVSHLPSQEPDPNMDVDYIEATGLVYITRFDKPFKTYGTTMVSTHNKDEDSTVACCTSA